MPLRRLLFSMILAVHIGLLVLIGLTPASTPVWRSSVAILAVTQIPLPPPSTPPLPALPVPPRAPPIERPPPLPPPLPQVTATAGCAVDEAVRSALAAADAMQALTAIPRQARSVANVVMLWDGGWARPSTTDEVGAQLVLKVAVSAALLKAPVGCLDQPLAGPRLFAVETGAETISLAIGSGRWRWRDLLAPDPPSPDDASQQASIGSHQVD